MNKTAKYVVVKPDFYTGTFLKKGTVVELDVNFGDRNCKRGNLKRSDGTEIEPDNLLKGNSEDDSDQKGSKKESDAPSGETLIAESGLEAKHIDSLTQAGLKTVLDVLNHNDLTKIKGIGDVSAKEILEHFSGE